MPQKVAAEINQYKERVKFGPTGRRPVWDQRHEERQGQKLQRREEQQGQKLQRQVPQGRVALEERKAKADLQPATGIAERKINAAASASTI